MVAFDAVTILNQWNQYGVFDYVLPFLLIFAIVYAILAKSKIFGENRAVHAIAALAIGLMALRAGFVTDFFTQAFSRLGVAISIMLVAVILTAAFIPKSLLDSGKGLWIYFSLGAILFVFVIFNSFDALNWFGSDWFNQWGGAIIGLLLIGGILAVIVATSK